MCKSIGVLISGDGTNLQAIIDKVDSNIAEVAVVISNKRNINGLERAKKHNIPTHIVERHSYESERDFNLSILDILQLHGVELVVLAGYMRILGREVLDQFPNRVINLHPSLLPSFKGPDAIKEALDYGVKYTGVTVHFATDSLDYGPIILQEPIKTHLSDNVETLSERIHEVEHELLPKAIELFCTDRLEVMGRKVFILR